MNSVLSLTAEDRAQLFKEAAARLGIATPTIVEKDFWVSWLLKQLFGDAKSNAMVFKGGTSLSKAFKLIKRFSEDCDITISREYLGFNEAIGEVAELGSKRRKRYFESLHGVTTDFIQKQLHSKLSSKCEEQLPPDWALEIDTSDPQVINFTYPKSLKNALYPDDAYIRPIVKLEFGSRGSTIPANVRKINAHVNEAFPDLCSDVVCETPVLEPVRTFWEKVTLLHQLAHWPNDKPIRSELARHYYDILMLSTSEQGQSCLRNLDLLIEVADHKSVYFRHPKASYETAKPGTLKLLPNSSRLKDLKKDYQSMGEMFFEEPPHFDELVAKLKELENSINNQ